MGGNHDLLLPTRSRPGWASQIAALTPRAAWWWAVLIAGSYPPPRCWTHGDELAEADQNQFLRRVVLKLVVIELWPATMR